MKMKLSLFAALAATLLLLPFAVRSAEQDKTAAPAAVECIKDKADVPTCSKASATPEPASAARARRECVFTCKKSHGIWVCKGNGPQCNGKSPWD